jgi:hypothetical protein
MDAPPIAVSTRTTTEAIERMRGFDAQWKVLARTGHDAMAPATISVIFERQ